METSFEQKESYKWVEALTRVEKLMSRHTRVVHAFDREGDITEVFDRVRQLQHTGVIVRAAHNRSLDSSSERLWSKLEAQQISFDMEIELPKTCKRSARQTKLAVRFCPVNLRTPYRFDNRDPILVYAVYATEINCPEGETPVEWMLLSTCSKIKLSAGNIASTPLTDKFQYTADNFIYRQPPTTEVVADIQTAATILRWYSYRWRVEEYHKIFKSGCQVERYKLAADGMKPLIGFLSVIAVELLQLTYLHRTQPSAPAIVVLNPLQLQVLSAKSPKLPKVLTVS